jgi:hypothetical protein
MMRGGEGAATTREVLVAAPQAPHRVHGTMSIFDRPGLAAIAGECYGVMRDELDRLMTA